MIKDGCYGNNANTYYHSEIIAIFCEINSVKQTNKHADVQMAPKYRSNGCSDIRRQVHSTAIFHHASMKSSSGIFSVIKS
jgi:hypothetical protein